MRFGNRRQRLQINLVSHQLPIGYFFIFLFPTDIIVIYRHKFYHVAWSKPFLDQNGPTWEHSHKF